MKSLVRSLSLAVVAALVAALVAGCPGGGAAKFGAVLPLTGAAKVYGESIQRGIEVAVAQVNADPQQKPKIEIQVLDSGSDPQRAKNLLDQAYDGGAIAAIGGVTSAEALAMVEIADDANRVLLSPSASQPQLTGISSNFYRVFPSDASEGTMMATYARNTLGITRVMVLAKQETYAKGAQEIFRERVIGLGGQVLETLEFPPNTTDFAAFAERVMTVKPEAVYIAAFAEEIVALVRELRREGFTGTILTTSSFSAGETIARAGAEAEKVYFTQTAFDPEQKKPVVESFVAAYRARYSGNPDLYAAHGYDAVRVLVAALKESGSSPTNFWKGMRGIRDFPGVTGTFQFDERGDVKKFPRVYQVQSGKALDLETEREKRLEETRRKMRELEEQLQKLQTQGNN